MINIKWWIGENGSFLRQGRMGEWENGRLGDGSFLRQGKQQRMEGMGRMGGMGRQGRINFAELSKI